MFMSLIIWKFPLKCLVFKTSYYLNYLLLNITNDQTITKEVMITMVTILLLSFHKLDNCFIYKYLNQCPINALN